LHSNEDQKYAFVYPLLKTVDISSSCIIDLEQDLNDGHIKYDEGHKFVHEYPSLKVPYPSPCTFEPDQKPSFKSYDVNDHFCKLPEIKTNVSDVFPHVPNPISTKTQKIYIPLKLPLILHDFPLKHYKYLPMIDGGFDKIFAEKHIQGFEHFLDLFEVEHVDVCFISFSQS
jgi:hypothetical protein